MKRAKNKSNLSIIQDYVDDVRPFTQISMVGTDELSKRKEGEEWTDATGKKWKKKNGVKTKLNKIKTTALDVANQSYVCSICKCDTRFSTNAMKRFDQQVIFKTRKCYDCFIEFETLLKFKGFFNDYEKFRSYTNFKNYLLDFRQKLNETVNWCNSPDSKKIQSLNDTGINSVELQTEYDTTDKVEIVKRDAIKDLAEIYSKMQDVDKFLSELNFDYNKIKDVEKFMKKKYKKGRNTEEFKIKMGSAN
jgi:hypothetical protein